MTTETTATATEEKPNVGTPNTGSTVPTPATKLSRKQQSEEFIKAFGEQHGPTLFSQFDTMAEAQTADVQILRTENEKIKADLVKFSASAQSQTQGEKPVSFSAAPVVGATGGTVNTKWSNLPESRRKICQGTNMPGATATK